MTYTCLIVDDEPLAIRVLEKFVERLPRLSLAGACSDAIAAGAFLQEHHVDLLFLDINMPELSGISFLHTLKDPPPVIFTTAYPEYALQGFELDAVDYLVKPIAFERFLKAANKGIELLDQQRRLRTLDTPPAAAPRPLLVRADRKLYRIAPQDILYLQAYGDYVKIVTGQGNITPKCTLQELEDQLPAEGFFRVHRSYVVALSAIQYIEGNHVRIHDALIPIAQAVRDELMSRLS